RAGGRGSAADGRGSTEVPRDRAVDGRFVGAPLVGALPVARIEEGGHEGGPPVASPAGQSVIVCTTDAVARRVRLSTLCCLASTVSYSASVSAGSLAFMCTTLYPAAASARRSDGKARAVTGLESCSRMIPLPCLSSFVITTRVSCSGVRKLVSE